MHVCLCEYGYTYATVQMCDRRSAFGTHFSPGAIFLLLHLSRQGLYFIYYFCCHRFALETGPHCVAMARRQALSCFCQAVSLRLAKVASSSISCPYLAVVML